MTNDAADTPEARAETGAAGTDPAEASDPTETADPAEAADPTEAADPAEAAEAADPAEAPDPAETATAHEEVEVGLVRSVRHGRIILTAVVVFAVLGMIAALFFPVAEDAEYTLGQVVGYMSVVGAIVGLVLGSLLALLLGLVAKRRRGQARAVQVDMR